MKPQAFDKIDAKYTATPYAVRSIRNDGKVFHYHLTLRAAQNDPDGAEPIYSLDRQTGEWEKINESKAYLNNAPPNATGAHYTITQNSTLGYRAFIAEGGQRVDLGYLSKDEADTLANLLDQIGRRQSTGGK